MKNINVEQSNEENTGKESKNVKTRRSNDKEIVAMHNSSEISNSMADKIHEDNSNFYSIVMILLLIGLIIFMTSCTKNVEFVQSSVVPAAQGHINVTTDNNKNYIIKIQVTDLADVSRLHPTNQTYVVWAETDEGNNENIGQLTSTTSFFSGQREASLKSVSSYKPKKIFITAETNINVHTPSEFVVLTTEEFK